MPAFEQPSVGRLVSSDELFARSGGHELLSRRLVPLQHTGAQGAAASAAGDRAAGCDAGGGHPRHRGRAGGSQAQERACLRGAERRRQRPGGSRWASSSACPMRCAPSILASASISATAAMPSCCRCRRPTLSTARGSSTMRSSSLDFSGAWSRRISSASSTGWHRQCRLSYGRFP